MAETLGSLIDKLCISKIRASKLAEKGDTVTFINVNAQSIFLTQEIDEYVELALAGQAKVLDPKFKLYKGENPSNDEQPTIGVSIARLFDANKTLWDLEDRRRDKSLPDQERLEVCDDVAKFNRLRNDSIDNINAHFAKILNVPNRP